MHHYISGWWDRTFVRDTVNCSLEWLPGAHNCRHASVPQFRDCRRHWWMLRELKWEVFSTSPRDRYIRKCRPQYFSRYRLSQPGSVRFQELEIQRKIRRAVPSGDV